MKKHILFLMIAIGLVSPHNVFSEEAPKDSSTGNCLILRIDSEGKVHTGGKQVDEEKLSKFLKHIAEIDKSFSIIVEADKSTPFNHVKKVMQMLKESQLLKADFRVLENENTKVKPIAKPKEVPKKKLTKLDIFLTKDGSIVDGKKKSLKEIG
jgi:biopolymer transport protein ExbD